MHLSVIIPAYNEEKRIEKTLRLVCDYLSRQPYDYEVIVVNDGSKDGTADAVRKTQVQFPQIILLDNKINQGKGGAVRDGILKANGDLRIFMDADNSTTVEQVENFLPWVKDGYDVIIGSRRIKGAEIAIHQPWHRDFLGAIFRFVVRTIVPVDVEDSQAGFKLFTAKAAAEIFGRLTISRWAFDVEALAIAHRLGFKIKEAPIVWRNYERSHVKFSGMLKMLFEILEIRLNLCKKVYNKS
ncbi:MAG: family 2 glycosyl transferase [Parcubacteria group bacterium Licking1014_17]|nr:MAG: family 2 glycosyl transferase [Parcubacteria group bacterium Licking1014_17]